MDITNRKDLLYRQQYVIGPHEANHFPSWHKHALSESLLMAAHPDLTITQQSKGNASLTLLGYLLDPARTDHDNSAILNRLLAENGSAIDLIRSTFELCGNWVLIFKDDQELVLFHDCAGAKTVYYTDTGKTGDLWLASQPRLIANLINIDEEPKAIDFISELKTKTDDYWWPGEKSPYSEIKALLPNHYLDLRKGNPCRYWPDRELIELSENDVIDKVSNRLQGIMAAAAQRFDLALALSCGLDSRLMLAASRHIIEKVCIYNGKRPEMSSKHPDVRIPKLLAKKLNLQYHFIRQTNRLDDTFRQVFELNASHPHELILPGLHAEKKHFNRQKVGVTGNVLEVARFYYKIVKPADHPPTGMYLAMLAKMNASPFAVDAFEDWLKTANVVFNLNVYDLFYWEQRLGRWFSNNCLVFYMAWKEVLFPFNCRRLLSDLLSVSAEDRMPPNHQFFKDLIGHMWPELLSEPINPVPKISMASRMVNKLKRMM